MTYNSSNISLEQVEILPILSEYAGSAPKQIRIATPFSTENGAFFPYVDITYHTYGTYSTSSKVIWVCHALTGNSDVFDWWPGLFGKDDELFNPKDYFIVCANAIGSAYGSTGPDHFDTDGQLFLNRFPLVTPRDMARVHNLLREKLNIHTIDILIGASLGGQQAVEWAIETPELIKSLILVATNARHSAYGIAYNESQRLAIYNDPTYGNGSVDDAKNGLKVARSIAMISYRSYEGYGHTQTEQELNKSDNFKAASYQRYQGEKLAKRFNAYAYVTLSKAMDSHNVGRNRVSIESALQLIRSKTLVIGIDSDNLFPLSEQKHLAKYIKDAEFATISSIFGHDGFLVEGKVLSEIIEKFLKQKP